MSLLDSHIKERLLEELKKQADIFNKDREVYTGIIVQIVEKVLDEEHSAINAMFKTQKEILNNNARAIELDKLREQELQTSIADRQRRMTMYEQELDWRHNEVAANMDFRKQMLAQAEKQTTAMSNIWKAVQDLSKDAAWGSKRDLQPKPEQGKSLSSDEDPYPIKYDC